MHHGRLRPDRHQTRHPRGARRLRRRLRLERRGRTAAVFRNFPLTQVHPHAEHAADAAEAGAAAGLRWGDVIFAIGDVPVEQLGDMSNVLTYRFRPGETVEIKFARGTGEQVARVTLGEKAAPYGGLV